MKMETLRKQIWVLNGLNFPTNKVILHEKRGFKMRKLKKRFMRQRRKMKGFWVNSCWIKKNSIKFKRKKM